MALADEQKGSVAIYEELEEFIRLVDQVPELAVYFGQLRLGVESGRQMIEKLFRGKISDLLVDAIQVMNRKGRLALLRPMAAVLRQLVQNAQGFVDVKVESAVQLPDAIRGGLQEWLQGYTGKKPVLLESVDPSLLGGLIVRIGDEKFDMSVSTRLESLLDQMLDRASREIQRGTTHLGVSK